MDGINREYGNDIHVMAFSKERRHYSSSGSRLIILSERNESCSRAIYHNIKEHKTNQLHPYKSASIMTVHYAGTSLNCAGIQRWKSVSFRCWAAINLVARWAMRSRTPHPLPYPPFSLLTVKSSASLLALGGKSL